MQRICEHSASVSTLVKLLTELPGRAPADPAGGVDGSGGAAAGVGRGRGPARAHPHAGRRAAQRQSLWMVAPLTWLGRGHHGRRVPWADMAALTWDGRGRVELSRDRDRGLLSRCAPHEGASLPSWKPAPAGAVGGQGGRPHGPGACREAGGREGSTAEGAGSGAWRQRPAAGRRPAAVRCDSVQSVHSLRGMTAGRVAVVFARRGKKEGGEPRMRRPHCASQRLHATTLLLLLLLLALLPLPLGTVAPVPRAHCRTPPLPALSLQAACARLAAWAPASRPPAGGSRSCVRCRPRGRTPMRTEAGQPAAPGLVIQGACGQQSAGILESAGESGPFTSHALNMGSTSLSWRSCCVLSGSGHYTCDPPIAPLPPLPLRLSFAGRTGSRQGRLPPELPCVAISFAASTYYFLFPPARRFSLCLTELRAAMPFSTHRGLLGWACTLQRQCFLDTHPRGR